jgi:hypothetical protein
MANASKGKKRKLAYKLRLIAYLDILGFRDLIKSKPPGFISQVIGQAIQWTSPDKKDRKAFQENYVNFSDLIVHTIPLETLAVQASGGDLYYETKNLAFAQGALINEGVLLRGALTLGLLERTYKVLFGPGLIAGYELERHYAKFPRIILSPDLFRQNKATRLLWAHEFKEEMKYIGEYVKRDDGVVFIDYRPGEKRAEPKPRLSIFCKLIRSSLSVGSTNTRETEGCSKSIFGLGNITTRYCVNAWGNASVTNVS